MQETNPSSEREWAPPLLLEGVSPLSWPQEVFPAPFETFVLELSRSTETPIELSAILTLSVVATVAQKKYRVQVKPDYHEPLNLWALGILPPASRKSRVYQEVTLPLRLWEHRQKERMEADIQSASSKQKTMEVRLKELRTQAAKADETRYDQLQVQIERLEREFPAVPLCPQIWTGDVTPEHLGTIMAANNEAMAVLSDEGGIFDILGGLYSDGKANIDLFLQSHAASPVRVDRGSRPPLFMQRPVLTMGLTVQPQVIKNICGNKTFRGRGLLGRFLYVIPKSNIGLRTLDEPSMAPEHSQMFQVALEAILSHPEVVLNDIPAQHVLRLSKEAFEKWRVYAKTIERLMGDELGHLSHITDWAGKLPGAIARIAALLHIMRHAHGRPWEEEVSLNDMTAAVKIGHVLSSHALVAFDLLHEDSGMEVARAIFNWLKQEKTLEFTQRQCMRKFRRFKKEELKQGFTVLKEHEILRELDIHPKPGRPSDIYEVNPLLHKP